MISVNEINAMVMLLDDNDQEVVRHVEEKLLSLGEEAIPFLESQWSDEFSMFHQEKLEQIIHQIQFESVRQQLAEWMASPQQDLFEGWLILTRYQYPSVDKEDLNQRLEKIKMDAWLELHNDLTALEKVRILNHVFYEVNGFTGNTTDYHNPSNSYINTVLEQRRGNPISLAIVYSIVAQRLGIAIFGVNLPQHFILAYMYDKELRNTGIPEKNLIIRNNTLKKVMFYLNPFNQGLIFTKQNVDEFIRQLKINPMDEFYLPCNNVEILKRVIRNLVSSYTRLEKQHKIVELSQLMEVLGGRIEFEEE